MAEIEESKAPNKDNIIRFRVSPELKERYEALAHKKGMNASEFLRYLIMQEVEKEAD